MPGLTNTPPEIASPGCRGAKTLARIVALAMAVASLPPMMAAEGVPVGAQAVASEIKAKGEVLGAPANVIIFGGPAGDGRRGAKGVLLRNEPSTGSDGSTRSFDYTWTESAFGVQIFHPKGRGQVIINLGSTKVGLCTPKAWREVGYKVLDPTRVKMTSAARQIFPLKANATYSVVSTVQPGGKYTLSINGRVVATGRVGSTSPLSLEFDQKEKFPDAGHVKLEWTGRDLPLQWAAGYAALLVGPTDTTPNICRSVFFTPRASGPL